MDSDRRGGIAPTRTLLSTFSRFEAMKRVILIRHGQSQANLRMADVVAGQSNESPLTALGEQQAAALGRQLHRYLQPHHCSPAFVVGSTAVRARNTARIMLQHYFQDGHNALVTSCSGHEPIELEQSPEILELAQGDWEGAPRSQCYTPETLAAIEQDPLNFAAPGGESQAQVEQRVNTFVEQQVLPRLVPGGPPGLVVSHGLAIKCFLRGVLQSRPALTWKIRLDNTAVTEVAWVETGAAAGWHILRVNDTTHLALEGVEI